MGNWKSWETQEEGTTGRETGQTDWQRQQGARSLYKPGRGNQRQVKHTREEQAIPKV